MEATRPTSVRHFVFTRLPTISTHHILVYTGTDHQKIAKLDRENEVAPPPKVAPSVGKVRNFDSLACASIKR